MSNKNYFQRLIGRFAPGGTGMEKGSGNIRHGRRVMRTRLRNEDTFNEFVSAWGRQDEIPLNVQSIRQILRDADEGSPGALAVLFRRILDSEPAITSHFRTRILAALACDWSVSSETHPRRAASGFSASSAESGKWQSRCPRREDGKETQRHSQKCRWGSVHQTCDRVFG